MRYWIKGEREKMVADIVAALDKRIAEGVSLDLHAKTQGVRSRQVVALIELLVEKGIL